MQWVIPVIGDAFGPVEQALQETFIPALFQGLGEVTPGRGVTCLPVKQVGLALSYPINTAHENHRWELPGNYPVLSMVVVIYHYVERIWRILVTPNFLHNIYNQE